MCGSGALKDTIDTTLSSKSLVQVRAATHPLKVGRVDALVREGKTIAEIFESLQPDPILRRAAHVYIGKHYIPKENWGRVRPRAGSNVTIRAFIPPTGGGGGGAKSILRIVLMVAVVALSLAAPYLLPGIGIAAGTPLLGGIITAGQLATVVVGFVGMLAVNMLVPVRPPKLPQLSGSGAPSQDSPSLYIQGARNRARPFDCVPVLLGRHRMVPTYGARPYTEIVGDDTYIRLLFVWGVGPISLSDFKIGETSLDDFEGVQVEHREGYDSDDPLTLFPASVDQQDFNITLTQTDGWQTRTTSPDADEISVDLTFPQGLVSIASATGAKNGQSVVVQIEYSVSGADDWQPIPMTDGVRTFPDTWLNDQGSDGSFSEITFTHARLATIRHGISWKVPTRGKYDVRIRRTSNDLEQGTIQDILTWTALRRITVEDPINSPVPLAKTALRIKATNQLNGIIDEFSGIGESVVMDYDATTPAGEWIERESRNPASLFRHVLQCNGLQEPLADSRINLDNLAEFHDWCEENGFEFNMVRDFTASVWDTLSDIAAAGRASPAQIDGKWGVVIDRPQDTPVSLVTPRNSSEFSASKVFADKPHGFRIRFPNQEDDWRQDERVIYRDGYTIDNATKFETLELPGVTDPDLIFKLGRFHLAAAELRPERWTFKQQMEHLVYSRGDRILINHDVLLVGKSSGRIKSIETDTSGDVTAIEVDQVLEMVGGTTYGISIRTPTDAQVTAIVNTVEGENTSITFVVPIPAASGVAVGDLFAFGEFGEETEDALVVSIEPETENRAMITAVPYRDAVYDADEETVPPFTPNTSDRATVPAPVILSLRSDESVLAHGPGDSLSARIFATVEALEDTSGVNNLTGELDVQWRPSSTAEPFFNTPVVVSVPEGVMISDVNMGDSWDLRFRWRVEGRLPSPWTTIFNHRVVGRSTPPEPLEGLTISAFGGQALMRWDTPPELDVVFGGEVRWRHSALFEDAEWSASVSIGEVARARDLVATLPLKPGTYMARVFDIDGNPSTVVSVTTKQASVLTYADLDSLDEAPLFAGVHVDTIGVSSNLQLAAAGLFDDIPDLDEVAGLDSYGGNAVEGTYYFATGFDFLTVTKVRLTTRITAVISNTLDQIDDRTTDIDSWEDFDGTDVAQADCIVYVRHTDDDPDTSGASWSSWERLDSAEFEARGFEFKAVLTSDDDVYNILVSELGIDAEEIA